MTASSLYLDHFQLNRTPFSQEPDTSVFFSEAGRREVLEGLRADIEAGNRLIKLIGSEGTGKTLMCRLLEQSLDHGRRHLLYLEHTIGSYENLLRTICRALAEEEENRAGEDTVAPDYMALLKERLRLLAGEGKSLLLFIDEAENLFLATLERLVRLIYDSGDELNLQIVLAGRLDLDDNLNQLAVYCPNIDVNTGARLEPLDLEETRRYIRFRVREAGIPGDKYLDLFSEDSIEMIFQVARGNISLTNSLAEQGLKKACAQGMFQVDEELLQPQQSLEDNVSLALFQGLDFLRDNKWWLLAGIALVWASLMLFRPVDEEKQPEVAAVAELEMIAPVEEVVVPRNPEKPGGAKQAKTVRIKEEKEAAQPKQPVPEERAGPVVPVQQEEKASNPVQPELIQSNPVQPEPVQPEPVQPEPVQSQPVRPEVSIAGKEVVHLEPDRRKQIVPPEPVPESKTVSSSRNADAVYNDRLKATSKWIAWAYRGGYTIQLMVLASANAEENLKKILLDDKYYAVRDTLYILKKVSGRTIYLYYGNYSSMEEGRRARDAMPEFLKDNQPYVLSIQDAMNKVKE